MKREHWLAAAVLVAACGAVVSLRAEAPAPDFRSQALKVLLQDVEREKGWIQIHAAETAIAVGHPAEARAAIKTLSSNPSGSAQRCGIFRVLAATASSAADRQEAVQAIQAIFLDPKSPDRLQAVESLNKLKVIPTGDVLSAVRALTQSAPEPERMFGWWSLQLAGDPAALPALTAGLSSGETVARLRGSYALRWLHVTDRTALAALARAADTEPRTTPAYAYLLCSAFTLDADSARHADWERALLSLTKSGAPNERSEACQALLARGTPSVAPELVANLSSPDGDTRIGAAWAILAFPR